MVFPLPTKNYTSHFANVMMVKLVVESNMFWLLLVLTDLIVPP